MKFDEKLIEQLVRETVLSFDKKEQALSTATPVKNEISPEKDFPLGKKRPDLIKTESGRSLNEITLEGILAGNITSADVRITAETLSMQAQVAEKAGRTFLAKNLLRAAELTKLTDQRVLEIYNALRPYRSTKQDLMSIGDELEEQYGAFATAKMVRDAAKIYEKRDRLKSDM